MSCKLCHKNSIIITNLRTQERKGFTIKKTNFFFNKKHVDVDHL